MRRRRARLSGCPTDAGAESASRSGERGRAQSNSVLVLILQSPRYIITVPRSRRSMCSSPFFFLSFPFLSARLLFLR
ncbi:hypothetical protein BDZ91DRAFT_731836 [Kalaharituber pfeilii]|nr:hypothetical protein BDZ91DRAFT_731836 [Kalaharituber pfeilii]